MVLLNINGKVLWGVHWYNFTFDCSDLEMPLSRSLRFRRLKSFKGSELGYMLLLDTNRKSHMDSPTAPSHLTLSDFVRSMCRSLRL